MPDRAQLGKHRPAASAAARSWDIHWAADIHWTADIHLGCTAGEVRHIHEAESHKLAVGDTQLRKAFHTRVVVADKG